MNPPVKPQGIIVLSPSRGGISDVTAAGLREHLDGIRTIRGRIHRDIVTARNELVKLCRGALSVALAARRPACTAHIEHP
jgi:hypothetical protein